MLTPSNVFIIGNIVESPVNPYELISRFNFHVLNDTLKMAESSIYANIRALNKRGLIEYTLEQSGNMPSKKVYRSTEKGKAELLESIRKYLSEYSSEWSGFLISLFFLHHFSKDELMAFLKKRRAILERLEGHKRSERETVMQDAKWCNIVSITVSAQHIEAHVREDLNSTIRIMDMIKEASIWPQNMLEVLAPDYAAYKEYGIPLSASINGSDSD